MSWDKLGWHSPLSYISSPQIACEYIGPILVHLTYLYILECSCLVIPCVLMSYIHESSCNIAFLCISVIVHL